MKTETEILTIELSFPIFYAIDFLSGVLHAVLFYVFFSYFMFVPFAPQVFNSFADTESRSNGSEADGSDDEFGNGNERNCSCTIM